MVEIKTTDRAAVLAFVRDAFEDAVVGVFNLTGEGRSVTLRDGPIAGAYRDFSTGEEVPVEPGSTLDLEPWGYRLLVRGAQGRS
jgi:hypothetical protein